MSLRNIFKIFIYINVKTIYFNFKYLPFRQAIKFPFFISRGTKLIKTRGRVFLHMDKIKPGVIKIGYLFIGIFNRRIYKVCWEVEGDVHFYGTAEFKYGSNLIVGEGAKVEFGDWFKLSTLSSIICYKKIVFGDYVHISWETIIMDTDFHNIIDESDQIINKPAEIIIGDKVWIGMRATIHKGVEIDRENVIASNAVVTKPIQGTNQIIAGNPAKVIKSGISWKD